MAHGKYRFDLCKNNCKEFNRRSEEISTINVCNHSLYLSEVSSNKVCTSLSGDLAWAWFLEHKNNWKMESRSASGCPLPSDSPQEQTRPNLNCNSLRCPSCGHQVFSTSWFTLWIRSYWSTLLANVDISGDTQNHPCTSDPQRSLDLRKRYFPVRDKLTVALDRITGKRFCKRKLQPLCSNFANTGYSGTKNLIWPYKFTIMS